MPNFQYCQMSCDKPCQDWESRGKSGDDKEKKSSWESSQTRCDLLARRSGSADKEEGGKEEKGERKEKKKEEKGRNVNNTNKVLWKMFNAITDNDIILLT